MNNEVDREECEDKQENKVRDEGMLQQQATNKQVRKSVNWKEEDARLIKVKGKFMHTKGNKRQER